MAWRVKSDSEFFYIPGGHVRAVLENADYVTEQGEIDYRALKSAIREEEIRETHEHPQEWGYIDLDQTEEQRSSDMVVVGDVYRELLRGRTSLSSLPNK